MSVQKKRRRSGCCEYSENRGNSKEWSICPASLAAKKPFETRESNENVIDDQTFI